MLKVLAFFAVLVVAVNAQAKCTAVKGSCIDEAECHKAMIPSYVQKGLCPGASNIVCCIRKEAPATTPVTPAPTPVTPAPTPVTPTPAPANDKCGAVNGVCGAASACYNGILQKGLCPGSSVCCAQQKNVPAALKPVLEIIDRSACASHVFTQWDYKNKKIVPGSKAPIGFRRGIALTFAKAVCNPSLPWAVAAGAAATTNPADVFVHYASQFKAAGLTNTQSGLTTLRHVFTLLYGLGICESSGIHCTGRDRSQSFTASDSAEAGLFQTSWGARVRSPAALGALFNTYRNSQAGCLYNYFSFGQTCGTIEWNNWGTGDGAAWQKKTKECPAFATEFAAILTRVHGGANGEWGPLRKFAAEVYPACDSMLAQVQSYVAANSASLCPLILA